MINEKQRKISGKALVQIRQSDGYKALLAIADDLDDDATKELKESEKGGDKKRGICEGLKQLFIDADNHMKEYEDSVAEDNS